ncbi:unnamed protein product [Clonostachys byssicola]|uniref:Heterokaryon incompatibility domain-containing protein n=1 Tax=Clonostachys byssicola TaxID=160290 RepID=A0A9N9U8F0_9HYPO|nr:unnamed protein product [Clonostachys byssicola]
MDSNSPPIELPIDHDFVSEEMLQFPRDPADRGTYSFAEPLTWAPLALVGMPKDWEHRGDHRLAEKLSLESRSSDFEARAFYFKILREWLLACDNHDSCKLPQDEPEFWPTRAIFVGDDQQLKLVEEPSGDRDYIVLSHCWGKPTKEEWDAFCTTPHNYRSRLSGFPLADLPKTFRDAIDVTRELGKQYLWIDALCIVQGPDGDWESEAGRMERVFANAYCTIAADSAADWKDGFLKPSLWNQVVPGSAECDCDFKSGVDEGNLMKRAWVIQERVLSRRTIHFTESHPNAAHTYWECGNGVRCQQFSQLRVPLGKETFIIDSYFPSRLKKAGYYRCLEFIQFLLEEYSKCGLTYKSDRDIAIRSLLERMGRELATDVRYGIVRCFIGSLLLWKRTAKEMTAPIKFERRTVPSWSWMAYDGSIEFIDKFRYDLRIPQSLDLGFGQDGKEFEVKIRKFENCHLGENNGDNEYTIEAIHAIEVLHSATKKVGSMWYDMKEKDKIEFNYCVVAGAHGSGSPVNAVYPKSYLVIVVQETLGGGGYRRIGVGTVYDGYLSTKSEAGRLL